MKEVLLRVRYALEPLWKIYVGVSGEKNSFMKETIDSVSNMIFFRLQRSPCLVKKIFLIVHNILFCRKKPLFNIFFV
jgi:hypothetical protein